MSTASKQLAIKEVLNLSIFDYVTGAEIFYADYASDTSIESKAERLDLRGGVGNYKLVSFDHTKDMQLKCNLPLVDLEFIALLTGKPISVGATNVPKREILTATSQAITLSATPVTGTLKIYLLSNARDNGTEQTAGVPGTTQNTYSISNATVTLNATTAPDATQFVVTYDYSAPATTRTMTFSANKFAKYIRVCGDGIVTDQVTGDTYYTKFVIPKCKPQNNFSLTMKSTEATTLDITMDCYSVDVSDGSGGIDKVYATFHELT